MINYCLNKIIKHYSGSRENSRLLVFNFHNIHKATSPLSAHSIPYTEFKQQILWINEHFKILPLDEGVEQCRSAKLEKPTACITLDDGYNSQYSLAKPLFGKLNIPATFFVSSGHLNKLLWNDHIPLFFYYSSPEQKELFFDKLYNATDKKVRDISNQSDQQNVIDELMKYLPLNQRLPLLKFMAKYIPASAIKGIMLNEKEVKEISDSINTIGAHTTNHPILAIENDIVANDEIEKDINTLSRITCKRINIFAYPNGKPVEDFTDRDIQILIKNNVDYAVITQPGYYSPGLDQMQIPRVNLSGKSSFKHYKTVISALRQSGKLIKSRGYEKTC